MLQGEGDKEINIGGRLGLNAPGLYTLRSKVV